MGRLRTASLPRVLCRPASPPDTTLLNICLPPCPLLRPAMARLLTAALLLGAALLASANPERQLLISEVSFEED